MIPEEPGDSPAVSTDTPEGAPQPDAERRWLTRGVLGVGGASLFSDSSHELVTSLLPTFLTSTLHSGPAVLGAIDGTADALTGLAKLAGGPLANDPRRRARLASSGYIGTAVATAAIGLATAVWQVAVLRAFAWMSRGIRSPARDMLLTSIAPKGAYGRAFGVERARGQRRGHHRPAGGLGFGGAARGATRHPVIHRPRNLRRGGDHRCRPRGPPHRHRPGRSPHPQS